ncbi:MAG: gamma-glutamyl-gamma-aminobutyrate hydrolase family protein [Bdellovibrionota bacterium]
MRKFLVLLLALSSPVYACKLPPKTKLVIGCTYKCGIAYKFRLNLSAWAMGYKIEVVDLRDLGPLEEALKKVDGVVMPGGADINPDYYSDKVTPEMREYLEANRGLASVSAESNIRDPYEYSFIRSYIDSDKNSELPLLGICRGMQMMTVGQGMPLYLDIKTELGIKNRRYLFDRVHLEKNSTLDEIYRNDSFMGFKMHHQGLRVPYWHENESQYPNMKVTAYSNQGRIAEGIEYLNRPAIGVQYHPEKSLTSTAAPIFRWLLNRSCEYKTAKATP